MKRFKNILVATDTRHDTHPIVDQAVEIAQKNNAKLKIIDVVPAFSWFARQVTADHEHLSELIGKEKQEKLAALAEKIRAKGVGVETDVLHGQAAVEIIREVINGEHDLVVAVAKGRNSNRKGFFGQTAMRLLRQCPVAVWLVTPATSVKFHHVLGCIDTGSEHASDAELNDKVFELAQSISKYHDARFSILHAWTMDDEEILGTRLKPEMVNDYVRDERRYQEEKFEKFLAQFETNSEADNMHLVKGRTATTIAEFIENNEVDLVVMGTLARAGFSGFFIGNTAEKILDQIECSVLAVKPYNFKSSIRAK